jgi:bla regulator protein BlaR1
MMPFALHHVVESTIFCSVLFLLARWFTKGAAARHAIGLVGVSKFMIPSLLLAPTGARLAFFWPAAPWLSSAVSRVSALLSELGAIVPTVDEHTARVAACVWAVGIVATGASWFARLRSKRAAFGAPTPAEENALRDAMAVLRIPLAAKIATSDAANGPVLYGIWRPLIVVPRGLMAELSAREFQAVLLHELAHARRLDNLAAVLIHCVVCLFWFNPLLWFMESWLQAQRERACDELVLHTGVQPRVYAAGIVKVCRMIVTGATPGVSAMCGPDLKTRLRIILESRDEPRSSYAPRVLIAALGLLMTLVPLAGGYCSQCVSNGPPSHSALRSRR